MTHLTDLLRDFPRHYDANGERVMLERDVLAALSAAPVRVRVKPLEWEPSVIGKPWHSAWCPWGWYYAQWDDETQAWFASLEMGEIEAPIILDPSDVPTIEEAKAAAQRDYEARILAALEAADHVNEAPKSEHDAGALIALATAQAAQIAGLEAQYARVLGHANTQEDRAEAAEAKLAEVEKERDSAKGVGITAIEVAEAHIATLTAQVEAMRGELAEANRRLGGGCDGNAGGDHHVITQGKYHFCANCGESLTGVRFCHMPRAALTTEKTNG